MNSGKKDGVTAEFVKLGGTRMGEPAEYRVIVDRISHEVEYYRGYLKHAVLQGTYVINNPFWWTADDKFFNYAVAAKLGVAIPKTILLPQKGYPADVDINSESLRNLKYPMDWDGAARLRRPAGDSEAVFGRRMEARLQGEQQGGAARGLRQDFAVLHDAAGVHRFRPIRALLHVRQDGHYSRGVRSEGAAISGRSQLSFARHWARAS